MKLSITNEELIEKLYFLKHKMNERHAEETLLKALKLLEKVVGVNGFMFLCSKNSLDGLGIVHGERNLGQINEILRG